MLFQRFGVLGALVEASWEYLGLPWGTLAGIWRHLGLSLARGGRLLEYIRWLLGVKWDTLGYLGFFFESFRAPGTSG